jgi:hypothetical protein
VAFEEIPLCLDAPSLQIVIESQRRLGVVCYMMASAVFFSDFPECGGGWRHEQ